MNLLTEQAIPIDTRLWEIIDLITDRDYDGGNETEITARIFAACDVLMPLTDVTAVAIANGILDDAWYTLNKACIDIERFLLEFVEDLTYDADPVFTHQHALNMVPHVEALVYGLAMVG